MAKKEILNNDAVTLRVGETAADILDEVAEVTGKTLDVMENTIDAIENTAERVVTVTKNNPFLIAGALLLGLGIGGFVAYKLTEKRLETKFEEELTKQIDAAKEFHSRVAKDGVFESPESTVKALVPDEVVDAVRSYQGREKPIPYNEPDKIVDPRPPIETVVQATVETVEVRNVFDEAAAGKARTGPPDWDMRAEIADRELHPDQPYTISFEEFNENEVNHEQTTLMYYVQDDTLVDAQDKPIDKVDYMVGDDNLTRFGHGSGDPNVVYVRNERVDMDFEIVKSEGSYHREVFGTDPDPHLQHSRRRSSRRSWRADE